MLVDRPQVDAYELPLGEPGAHHAAAHERVGRDDRLRRGEVVAAPHVGPPDALLGVDKVPAEQNEVLGGEGVDEGIVVNVDLTELRALHQSDEDVHIPIMSIDRERFDQPCAGDLQPTLIRHVLDACGALVTSTGEHLVHALTCDADRTGELGPPRCRPPPHKVSTRSRTAAGWDRNGW